MTAETLKQKVIRILNLIQEIESAFNQLTLVPLDQRDFFNKSISELLQELKIANNSLPMELQSITLRQNLPAYQQKQQRQDLRQQIKTNQAYSQIQSDQGELLTSNRIISSKGQFVISDEERKKLAKELGVKDDSLFDFSKIGKKKKKSKKKEKEVALFRKPSKIVVFANSLFGNISNKLSKKPSISKLSEDLRKANIPYLLSTYISLVIFSVFIVGLFGLIITIFLSIFKVEIISSGYLPFKLIIKSGENILKSVGLGVIITGVLTLLTFFIGVSYPKGKGKSINNAIVNELPFASMHMGAVSGSGIEPSKIFNIIAKSKEYKKIGLEAKKIMNQINVYGYDLITSLKNVAKVSPSKKLAELWRGVATTISSGGNLTLYFSEKSKDYLLDYRLRRKKDIETSGTYSDVYTGLLIAAPLIFMLLLVLINLIGGALSSFGVKNVAILGIGAIVLLNIGFLIFLKISQPGD